MSVDNSKKHFHLTPRGWIAGSRWFFEKQQADIPRPIDAIAKFQLHISQRSQWSSEPRSWTKVWHAESANDELISALQAQFVQPDEDSQIPEA